VVEVKDYSDIYMSIQGKQMVKTTKLTFEEDSVLIETNRREVGKEEIEKLLQEETG